MHPNLAGDLHLWNPTLRGPHSTYQKVLQGKCPLHFLHYINGVVCSNTLFSNTSALTISLLFKANSTSDYMQRFSNTSFGRTLPGSNFGGLLLEQTFCRHSAAFPNTIPLCGIAQTSRWDVPGTRPQTVPGTLPRHTAHEIPLCSFVYLNWERKRHINTNLLGR